MFPSFACVLYIVDVLLGYLLLVIMVQSYGWRFGKIKQDRRKYETSLNSCKSPTSLEESWKPSDMISVASDNYGSECNNDIVTDMNECNDGSVKLSLPSDMRG